MSCLLVMGEAFRTRAVKKNKISNISRIFKKNPHLHSNFRCASGSLISGARDAMKM